MTKVYDFSVFDIREHNYAFSEMTQTEIGEKKTLFEEYQKNKAQAAAQPKTEEKKEGTSSPAPKVAKPVFKPKIKPPSPPKP
jgi:NADH-quinone oxidoreductase subunit I